MSDAGSQRPDLTPTMSGAELLRWYWLKSELVSLARVLGAATSGSKEELTTRIAAMLDGHAPPSRERPAGAPGAARGVQLTGDLSVSTHIPRGQRCSQELRGWFRAHVGPAFRFDRHMREFIQSADGTTTLGDAVKHWESTRSQPVNVIDPQFEFNRFTRAWHATNSSGTRADLLAAWRHYRDSPLEGRGRA